MPKFAWLLVVISLLGVGFFVYQTKWGDPSTRLVFQEVPQKDELIAVSALSSKERLHQLRQWIAKEQGTDSEPTLFANEPDNPLVLLTYKKQEQWVALLQYLDETVEVMVGSLLSDGTRIVGVTGTEVTLVSPEGHEQIINFADKYAYTYPPSLGKPIVGTLSVVAPKVAYSCERIACRDDEV